MLIERVSAHIRFSQDTGKGCWKTVELGAEAHIEPAEDWALAQQGLYSLLTAQLRQLWQQNGVAPGHGHSGPDKAIQPPPAYEAASVPHEHYCLEHQTAFRRFEKDGRYWYSHKADNGSWCKET
jgi:hypothetical protein